MRRALLLFSLTLLGCESGLSRRADVSIPEDVAASYSASSPGVLVAELGGIVTWHAPLCGQPLQEPMVLFRDTLYACLGETGGPAKGDEEAIRVWIEPLPTGWPADEVCAAVEEGSTHRPKSVPEGWADLTPEPEADWHQAEEVGTWERDASPCGGRLRVRMTLE